MKKGRWRNGDQVIDGHWQYNWASDTFSIRLDSRDPITGLTRSFTVYGDEPEWGNWKLERDDAASA